MDRTKGFGYCGLACCICSDGACPGCRREGCGNRDWCGCFRCGREKGHAGCWECAGFPCAGGMMEKTKVRAFARFLREYGEEKLMDCLERNERAGVVYHYPGGVLGDYDAPGTEEETIALILHGRGSAG